MPILARQSDIFPDHLLSESFLDRMTQSSWWVLHTKARTEKKLIERLRADQIPHYCPIIEKRYRSPAGRFRTSYVPLFAGYVFMLGDDHQRVQCLTTNYVAQTVQVIDHPKLVKDLEQVYRAISAGVPLTPESKLQQGDRVVVRSGPFQGFEGHVIRRENKTRLLLVVNFIEQGVSMEIDECQLTAC